MLYLALGLSVAAAILGQYFIKKLTTTETLSRAINIMFMICAVLALVFSFIFGNGLQFSAIVFVTGFMNALVAWLSWRAIKVSLSQTMLFVPLVGFSGLILIASFLGEWRFLNPQNLKGILTIVGALGLLGAIWFFRGDETQYQKIKRMWFWCIVGQSVAGGLIYFFIKYAVVQDVSRTVYLLSWYFGALAGSFVLRIFEKNQPARTVLNPKRIWVYYVLLSVATLTAVLTNYWALELGPATLILPLQQFFNVLGSILVGLFIFHEKENFGRRDWLGMAVGFVSMLLLLWGIN